MSEPISKQKIVAQIRHRLVLQFDRFRIQERERYLKALGFAEDAHKDEYRRPSVASPKRGLPYIVHPMRVCTIMLDELENKDPVGIIGSLLHDVIESNRKDIGVSDIENLFGRPVAMIVSVLTAPPQPLNETEEQRRSRKNIYYQRIRQASVISRLVKLADRLDSVREAPLWLDQELKLLYLKETRNIYLPIAEDTDSYLSEQLFEACQELEEAIKNPPQPDAAEEEYSPKK